MRFSFFLREQRCSSIIERLCLDSFYRPKCFKCFSEDIQEGVILYKKGFGANTVMIRKYNTR